VELKSSYGDMCMNMYGPNKVSPGKVVW